MKKLFINGNIFTSNGEHLYADALLVENGKVVRAGSRDLFSDVPRDGDTEIIDLKGRTVIPGLVDAHVHPMMLAEYSRQIACLPPAVNSVRQLIEEIGRVAKDTPEDGWVLGWGYDEGKYEEKRSPDRYDLDKGCADRPVSLTRSCGHIRCVNSRALEIAGITADTPDPDGGSIDRDENGEPTGVLREKARELINPFMPEETKEDAVSALVDLSGLLTSQGIVALTDMGNMHPGDNYGYYEEAFRRGFRQRLAVYYMWDYFRDDPDFDIPAEKMDHEKRLRVAGLKLIGDGSIAGRTAWLKEPYLGTEDCGIPVYSDEMLEEAVAFAKKKGCQLSVHAMGGRAIDRVIDRMYREDDWTDGQAPYLRVEHLTEPSEEAMDKAAEKGFAFVSQPIFEYCEIETYLENMDRERLKRIYPHRTELDKGIKLCFSTDAPTTSWAVPSDPFANIKAAVTRKAIDGTDIGRDERVDTETAVMLYTKNAAEICGFRGLGMLAAGYSADFAVLSEDIFSIDPARIDQVRVEETYISGEQVYAMDSTLRR